MLEKFFNMHDFIFVQSLDKMTLYKCSKCKINHYVVNRLRVSFLNKFGCKGIINVNH